VLLVSEQQVANPAVLKSNDSELLGVEAPPIDKTVLISHGATNPNDDVAGTKTLLFLYFRAVVVSDASRTLLVARVTEAASLRRRVKRLASISTI
jgi:hypothetical protein